MFGSGSVYEYSSATTRASPLKIPEADSARPSHVLAGELYNNTVYMLDADLGQIWRYPIAPEGLGVGSPYFRSSFDSLKDAVDLGIDGAVYVLLKNGTVQKFFSRQPQVFSITGIPEPIGQAAAIAVTGSDMNSGAVFILDAQSGAVVEFNKAGAFVRQYRGDADEFVGATDMNIDVARRTGYIVTSTQIYTFRLL
ncbi:MAG: hypothetical protein NTZ50_08550 [Chloroflexi bacterium]|nr:hypothetical protein [Chloroflexota bacterium]